MILATKLRKRFLFMGKLRHERSIDTWTVDIIATLALEHWVKPSTGRGITTKMGGQDGPAVVEARFG
jgi:hypothetical protein